MVYVEEIHNDRNLLTYSTLRKSFSLYITIFALLFIFMLKTFTQYCTFTSTVNRRVLMAGRSPNAYENCPNHFLYVLVSVRLLPRSYSPSSCSYSPGSWVLELWPEGKPASLVPAGHTHMCKPKHPHPQQKICFSKQTRWCFEETHALISHQT